MIKEKITTALPGVVSSAVALLSQHLFCCILPKIWPGFMAWLMSRLGLGHDAVTVLIVSFALTLIIYTAHFAIKHIRAKKHNCHCPSHCCDTQITTKKSLWWRYITDTELRYSLFFVVVVNVGVFMWDWWV
jgi:hypothetical protein